MGIFLRIYRLIFNPTPVPRQVWKIDGVGIVSLISVSSKIVAYKDERNGKPYRLEYWTFRQNASPQFHLLPKDDDPEEEPKKDEKDEK